MSTKGLKVGDIVEYNNSGLKFNAKVLEVSSTQKAVIQALTDVDETFNTRNRVNTYRKNMKIIEELPEEKIIKKKINSNTERYDGSVWSLFSVSDDDNSEPHADATVFLNKNATVDDAVKALKGDIDGFFNGRLRVDVKVPTNIPKLMKFIKEEFNDRSLSLHIKRVYPAEKSS